MPLQNYLHTLFSSNKMQFCAIINQFVDFIVLKAYILHGQKPFTNVVSLKKL